MPPVRPERIVYFDTADDAPSSIARDDRGGAQLSAADVAQFTTLCDLRLLAEDVDLDLTTKQWESFAATVVQAQTVRHAYEAQLARAKELAPGRYRLEIPAYAVAGDEMRRLFLADMQAGLGQEAAAEVMTKLGRKLEARFAGFGVSEQTLDITGDPVHAPGDVQVDRTALYWNSAEGTEHVTIRRETHFPAVEDPTGENWQALLALVGKAS